MKYFLILALTLSGTFAFAQGKAALGEAAAKYSLKQTESDVLQEEESTKSLILKYDSAQPGQKQAVKKEIEKKELAREQERIDKQKQRIKRQEEQIKILKQKLAEREKNKADTVKKRVEYLISEESVEKIKSESKSKQVIDKIKTKAKRK